LCRILVRPFLTRSGKAHPAVHIGEYVPEGATQQMNRKTNHMAAVFFSEALTPNLKP
jgi:hypothetical protein